MVFGIAFLLLVSMFISTVLSTMTRHMSGGARWIAIPLDVIVTLLVVSLLFGAIFKFLPDVKIAWKQVWIGALMTAALFTVGKYGLALYFKYGTPTSAFGAAGSLAAVLLWVYYSAFILFFGAEFTKVWSRNQGKAVVPDENAVAVGNQSHPCPQVPAARAGRSIPRHDASPARRGLGQNMPRPVAMTYMFVISAIAGSIGASYIAGKRHGEQSRA
jgi:membrane protein